MLGSAQSSASRDKDHHQGRAQDWARWLQGEPWGLQEVVRAPGEGGLRSERWLHETGAGKEGCWRKAPELGGSCAWVNHTVKCDKSGGRLTGEEAEICREFCQTWTKRMGVCGLNKGKGGRLKLDENRCKVLNWIGFYLPETKWEKVTFPIENKSFFLTTHSALLGLK